MQHLKNTTWLFTFSLHLPLLRPPLAPQGRFSGWMHILTEKHEGRFQILNNPICTKSESASLLAQSALVYPITHLSISHYPLYSIVSSHPYLPKPEIARLDPHDLTLSPKRLMRFLKDEFLNNVRGRIEEE